MRLPRASPRAALAVDAATAGVFTAVVLVELGLHWDDGYSAGSLALNLPLFLLITLPLAARRRAPVAALAVAFGSVAVSSVLVAHTLFFFGGLLPLTLLVYSAARYAGHHLWVVAAGPVALLITYPLHVPAFDLSDYAFGIVLFGAGGLAGRLVRRLEGQRRLLADALAARSREQAARERALLLDERARIARELHDVVAHAVSVMVVQAGAARFALGTDEEEVRERLLSVETTGRSAVDRPAPAARGAARGRRRRGRGRATAGARTAGQAGQRAAARRAAGAAAHRGVARRPAADGRRHRLPAGTGGADQRVKHSAAEWVQVEVRVDAEAVVLEVTDGGPARADAGLSAGQGLVGMGERVGLFGGGEAVPAGAGWRVRAELPLVAAGVHR